MILLLIIVTLVANISVASSQAIPYSYASGRNVTAVEVRYARFLEAKLRNAGPEELHEICGRVNPDDKCRTNIGRPSDSESLACDSLCCLAGKKVGNCGNDFKVRFDYAKIGDALGLTNGLTSSEQHTTQDSIVAIASSLNPSVGANCYCSDDLADVRCGRASTFLGITCPFTNAACWRKCCRQGRSGGRCEGFLNFACRCY